MTKSNRTKLLEIRRKFAEQFLFLDNKKARLRKCEHVVPIEECKECAPYWIDWMKRTSEFKPKD